MPKAFEEELKTPIEKWGKEMNKGDIQLYLDTVCSPLYTAITDFVSQNSSQVPPEFSLLLKKLETMKIETDFIKTANTAYAESIDIQLGEIDKTILTLETNSKKLRDFFEIDSK